MDGKAFLDVARELCRGLSEAHWRTAAGRAYYALLLEGWAALLRWGFVTPPHQSMHVFVRLRFNYAADPDLKQIGFSLDRLSRLRNQADYQPTILGPFQDANRVNQAVQTAEDSLGLINQVEADVNRLAAAIAGIRANFP
jgi:hypothetical protein